MSNDLNLLDQFEAAVVKNEVGVVEFAESQKFLGRKLYPRQKTLLKLIFLEELDDYDREVVADWESSDEIEISPKLLERFEYLRQHDHPHFSTVQLIGGRRSSKGFITGVAMAYRLYQLTMLDDLHDHYNLPRGKEVEFSIVAASLDQAVARQFADAQDAVLDCKPLQTQRLIGKVLAQSVSVNTPNDVRRARSLRASGVKIDKDMASLIVQAHGTNSKTIRGSASIMFVFDEMAHLIGGESRMSDEELWNASIPSVRQFRKDAMIFANSSPYTKTGKFYELYENAIELDPPEDGKPVYPDHFMLKFPSWELYKDWEKFPGTPPPQVFPPEEDPQLARDESRDPDTFKVEYRAQFAEVENAFLRAEMVDRMFDPQWNESMLGYIPEPNHGARAFARYKGHGDPASTGPANFGIAVGHIEMFINKESGLEEPHVVFDLIDAFYPEDFKDHTVDWLEVVPEVTRLINAYRPFEFTFDQFDSTMAIQVLNQELKKANVGDTIVREVTATAPGNKTRALNFRAALNLGRVHAAHPDYFNPLATHNSIELARDELKFLVEKNGKVDKQTIGPVKTKDIADCIMEVTDALIGDTVAPLQAGLTGGPQFGAQGGFGVGKIGNTDKFEELTGLYRTTGLERGYMGRPINDPARGIRRDRR